ncbi:MAG: hypothetical protein JNM72_02410 [Deltaproteobacteria bacterium]|nr:hypothetical protein [Deltaproteobacteria bacterium]
MPIDLKLAHAVHVKSASHTVSANTSTLTVVVEGGGGLVSLGKPGHYAVLRGGSAPGTVTFVNDGTPKLPAVLHLGDANQPRIELTHDEVWGPAASAQGRWKVAGPLACAANNGGLLVMLRLDGQASPFKLSVARTPANGTNWVVTSQAVAASPKPGSYRAGKNVQGGPNTQAVAWVGVPKPAGVPVSHTLTVTVGGATYQLSNIWSEEPPDNIVADLGLLLDEP